MPAKQAQALKPDSRGHIHLFGLLAIGIIVFAIILLAQLNSRVDTLEDGFLELDKKVSRIENRLGVPAESQATR
jgi:hypothetical protein